MKKLHLLSGMIVLSAIASLNAMETNRPASWKKVDQALGQGDWQAIFATLDRERIDANEYRDRMGISLLFFAASSSLNSLPAVKTLLEKYHVDPNAQMSNAGHYTGWTALETACAGDNLEIVKLLLKYGANPYLKDSYGNNSFTYAERHPIVDEDGFTQVVRHSEMLKLLQQYSGSKQTINITNKNFTRK